jgi:hypothetical protein
MLQPPGLKCTGIIGCATPALSAKTELTARIAAYPYLSSGEDRTAIELFLAGVRGWDGGLRRFLDASADER